MLIDSADNSLVTSLSHHQIKKTGYHRNSSKAITFQIWSRAFRLCGNHIHLSMSNRLANYYYRIRPPHTIPGCLKGSSQAQGDSFQPCMLRSIRGCHLSTRDGEARRVVGSFPLGRGQQTSQGSRSPPFHARRGKKQYFSVPRPPYTLQATHHLPGNNGEQPVVPT